MGNGMTSRRGLSIGTGAVLVMAALAWFVIRNDDALQPLFGMGTALGWIAHGAALLTLLAGIALLAKGIFGGARKDTAR